MLYMSKKNLIIYLLIFLLPACSTPGSDKKLGEAEAWLEKKILNRGRAPRLEEEGQENGSRETEKLDSLDDALDSLDKDAEQITAENILDSNQRSLAQYLLDRGCASSSRISLIKHKEGASVYEVTCVRSPINSVIKCADSGCEKLE